MRIPLITFDIALAPGATPVLTVYREDIASRIVEFLTTLARESAASIPTTTGLVAFASPHYVRVARVVDTPFSTLSEAQAAYFTLDEALMNRVIDVAVREHEEEKATTGRDDGGGGGDPVEPVPSADELAPSEARRES